MSHLKIFLRGILVLIFFISTLLLSFYQERIFVSPDENAAWFFAEQFAHTGTLKAIEVMNLQVDGVLHPRSILAAGEWLLPGSFLGLPIMTGSLLWLFGVPGALLFTPLLALLAVLAWRNIIFRIFADDLLADGAAFFLMLHPAFLYYSGRVMMHNVAFVACLILAFWLVVYGFQRLANLADLKRAWITDLLFFGSGILVGTSLFLRTAEIFWVLSLVILLFIWHNRLFARRELVVWFFGLGFMLLLTAGANFMVYGSPWQTGYNFKLEVSEVTSIATPSVISENKGIIEQVVGLILPFGFHPRAVLRHVWSYVFLLYPWMAWSAFFGFIILCYKKLDDHKAWLSFIVVFLILAVWLGLMYGSWTFNDNPDPRLISIGNSYVRYWLPLFVLSSVFASYGVVTVYRWLMSGEGLIKISNETKARWQVVLGSLRKAAASLFILGIISGTIFFSARLVIFGHDGIVESSRALVSFIEKREAILELTSKESVIIVDRADKYLFPERRVVVPLRSERTYEAMPKILAYAPLYYFGITFPESDLIYLNTIKLKSLGLTIELVETFNEESLYRITAE